MSDKITLFWCPKTRAARALWMIEELSVPYELVKMDLRDEKSRSHPDFKTASPFGKVPALVDGPVKLADSAAICLYLADKYPDAGLAPAVDDPLRAIYLFWTLYTTSVVEPAVAEKINGSEPKKYFHGWCDFETMIEVLLEKLSDGQWILGENFSAADVMIGSSINFLKYTKLLSDNPVADTYADRCMARPAYQRFMQIEAGHEE